MIIKLKLSKESDEVKEKHVIFFQETAKNQSIDEFIYQGMSLFSQYSIEFYEVVGYLLREIGFNVSVSREGDTNNRMDAIIIDKEYSIPIEIKSPAESEHINIKSVRQALENKIILLSRKFHPTIQEVTSLAIGYKYPETSSNVSESIEDIYKTFSVKVGIISFEKLLRLFFEKKVFNTNINLDEINFLKGQYD